ncbi:MAG: ABC transporter substrate-binding protein, partial [Thermoplasmata archaeon]|nr:ABC transporter substrate-binding protein [Thermoplasmata archaeon]
TVIVHLRPDVKFHDFATSGETMDADDVYFSYQALRDGTTLSSSIIDAFDADNDGKAQAEEVDGTVDHDGDTIFEGVTVIDSMALKMVMAKPYGQFFLSTLGLAIIPEHIWGTHVDGEGRLDTLWSHVTGTIATGPFFYKDGEQDVYRIMERFEDYWGKDELAPSGDRLYPEHVKQIYYRLYSSLDTAILALKSRQVDHLPWTVTPGYVPDLTSDPNTDLKYVSDNGYFYLAFNQKREPMNYLAFRQAVSHVIDKDTIVTRYMGGYGQGGDSSEPPFWTDWYNSSVETYTFDSASAESKLTDGGFTGVGTSLKMPDGRPVPDLVILTPPADYDPIRIKAGELIAKNLRSLGMNVIAKPLDFDALVAKMNAFDYDMLIIGWSLSSDPIGNVFDILGPMASQNYFAFRSTTNDNPWYKDLGAVSTLADAQTM